MGPFWLKLFSLKPSQVKIGKLPRLIVAAA